MAPTPTEAKLWQNVKFGNFGIITQYGKKNLMMDMMERSSKNVAYMMLARSLLAQLKFY